jgi:hypothetical protein
MHTMRFLLIILFPMVTHSVGPRVLTCVIRSGRLFCQSISSRILVNVEPFSAVILLKHFCIRFSRRPSAVSIGCWIWSPPLSKLAESLLAATSLRFCMVSWLSDRVHRKDKISLCRGPSSVSVTGRAMRTWLYRGTGAEFIRVALWRMSVGGVGWPKFVVSLLSSLFSGLFRERYLLWTWLALCLGGAKTNY